MPDSVYQLEFVLRGTVFVKAESYDAAEQAVKEVSPPSTLDKFLDPEVEIEDTVLIEGREDYDIRAGGSS